VAAPRPGFLASRWARLIGRGIKLSVSSDAKPKHVALGARRPTLVERISGVDRRPSVTPWAMFLGDLA